MERLTTILWFLFAGMLATIASFLCCFHSAHAAEHHKIQRYYIGPKMEAPLIVTSPVLTQGLIGADSTSMQLTAFKTVSVVLPNGANIFIGSVPLPSDTISGGKIIITGSIHISSAVLATSEIAHFIVYLKKDGVLFSGQQIDYIMPPVSAFLSGVTITVPFAYVGDYVKDSVISLDIYGSATNAGSLTCSYITTSLLFIHG